MSTIDNFLDTLHRAHCDNARQVYYAKRHFGQLQSTMPATSFVYEFFLFNALYQYDWHTTIEKGYLTSWSEDDGKSEAAQQARFEKFIRDRCRGNSELLKRAFDPLSHLDDLDGSWTTITPDDRITSKNGESFFVKLAKLRDIVASGETVLVSRSLFDLINDCRFFVYLVRNNIFHGSKSLGEIDEPKQRRRLEVYDIFLKSLVSLFFLSVGRSPVAADYVQIPIHIPLCDGSKFRIDQSTVADLVAKGQLKPEDSRLIRCFSRIHPSAPLEPDTRSALFYPSAGKDILAPTLLGLPCCAQFFFYDAAPKKRTPQVVRSAFRHLAHAGMSVTENTDESVVAFEIGGCNRTVHLVRRDNRDFLTRDVDLTFYFHRGDSWGEGGSGQQWDRLHLTDLGAKTPRGNLCRILTDGEPGGLHPDLRPLLEIVSIPISYHGQDYFFGSVPGVFLSEMKKTEQSAPLAGEA